MSAIYWVAKYVGDPLRNEPRNVGVIVLLHEVFAAKFVGERENGTFDGRKLRGFAHPSVYSQWRDFWRRKLNERDIEAIVRGSTPNYYVVPSGEVDDTGTDTAADVCQFLFGLLIGDGPAEAYNWVEAEESEVDLTVQITDAFEKSGILAREGQLFARHPVVREEKVPGRHVVHTPSYTQKNGRLYVMEHIDLSKVRQTQTRNRAGWMAYMFADIRSYNATCEAFSLVWPEADSGGEQIEYARNVLAGESQIVNWADEAERERLLLERRRVAEPQLHGN